MGPLANRLIRMTHYIAGDLYPQGDRIVPVELRKEDIAYNERIEKFLRDGCGCKKT